MSGEGGGKRARNIMLLIPALGIGGSERSVSNISKLLSQRYNIFVAVFNGKSAVMDIGGTLVDLKQPARGVWLKPYVAIRRVLALRSAIRAHRIDTLLGFTAVGCRYTAFTQKKVWRVLCNRGFEETVAREAFYIRLLKKCDALLFNSNASRHWFAKRNPALSRKVFALPNCFDLDAIAEKAKEAPDEAFARFCEGRPVIISVGRLCDVKGFDFLIRSFLLLLASIPEVRLAIVGDGPSAPLLKKLAKPGGDNILFVGARSNPFPYFAASRLYVLPSRTEGFPNALVEAMALSVPVIAANCDTGPNEIVNGVFDPELRVTEPFKARYGMLVPAVETPASDQAGPPAVAHLHLAHAMETMLTDTALYEGYRKVVAERARAFSFESSLARYASFFDEMPQKRKTDA